MQVKDLKLDKRNYNKHNDENKRLIKKSIDECGFGRSVVIDNDGEVICGNGVVSTLDDNTNIKVVETDGNELVVIRRKDLKREDEKRDKLAILDNSTGKLSEWDYDLLKEDFEEDYLNSLGIELPELDMGGGMEEFKTSANGSLNDRYITSPFSILNTRTGEWQNRKKQWIDKGLKSEVGRSENLIGYSPMINSINNGTSIFDPVLCEIAYSWFSKENDFIIDPFAGGSVRGVVASELQRNYLGLELREEQVKANIENADEICTDYMPTWKIGDSNKTLDTIENNKFDMCLSCPPYADLEVYSDDIDDLSNMPYDKFIETYQSIITKLYDKLKDNSFVVWVIGEVRNKKGNYYNFVGDTIKCFLNAGFNYYNEIILENVIGTAMLRVNKIFQTGRKVVKVHQNVLVFVKGDGKQSAKRLGEVKVKELNIDEVEDLQ